MNEKTVYSISEFLTAQELMQFLKCSRPAISVWQRQSMPVRRLGQLVRYELDKVLEWFDRRAQAGSRAGQPCEATAAA